MTLSLQDDQLQSAELYYTVRSLQRAQSTCSLAKLIVSINMYYIKIAYIFSFLPILDYIINKV